MAYSWSGSWTTVLMSIWNMEFFLSVCVFSGFNLLFEDKRLNSYVIPGLDIKPCSQSARQILSPICSVSLPPLP